MIGYFEGFNYGGEIAEADVHIKKWPTEGFRTCLVDADLLPYRVGFTIGELPYLTAKALVAQGHYSNIKETPQFHSAFEQLCMSLNKWIRDTKCDSAKLFTTKSDTNFRLNIAYSDPYKGQRPQEKPPFFSELKSEMEEQLGCVLADGIEADDMLSIEATKDMKSIGADSGSNRHKELCGVVVASSDKDSTITPSWNYNPDTRKLIWITELGSLIPKYQNKMVKHYEYVGTGEYFSRGAKAGEEKTKRVLIGEKPSSALKDLKGTGLKFFYAQIIMGDNADNYKGLSGKGMTAAFNMLENCKTEKDMYLAVLSAYKEVYGTGEHWCPNYQGTEEYYSMYKEIHGTEPEDFEFWRGKGAWLTAYDRMLEQGRLAWMMTYRGDIWRKDKGRIIDPHDRSFWHDKT